RADRRLQGHRRHRDRTGSHAAVHSHRPDHAVRPRLRTAHDVEDGRGIVMTERDDTEPPQAKMHLAKWSPWIWIIPAVAVFFAGYLVVRYGFFGGGDITVRFADAR